MSLYQLVAELENVINGGMVIDEETGEVLFDSTNLDELQTAFEDKLENCGIYIKNLDSEANAISQEIHSLTKRKKVLENKAQRMRDYVLQCMEQAERTKFDTAKVAISQRKSSYVAVNDEVQIPEDYKEIIETTKVDKRHLKDALKQGLEIPGAELKERINLQVS